MSYLDVPRIHFAGTFASDPSTVNNNEPNFDPSVALDLTKQDQVGWDARGKHWFSLQDCVVRSAVDSTGKLLTTSAQDPVVGATVETTNIPGFAKLVDLDPEWQFSSQVWGVELKVSSPKAHGSLTARMATATLRDLWRRRRPGGFPTGLGGVYQSVLAPVVREPAVGAIGSAVLDALASASRLSVKFTVYAYDNTSAPPKFGTGKVVGTIGVASQNELAHCLAIRLLEPAGYSIGAFYNTPFGPVPFKVDSARGRLVLDLSNAVPEQASGLRVPVGTMQAFYTGAAGPVAIGTVDYTRAHYETTAGIEELPVTSAQITDLVARPLSLRSGPPAKVVATERSTGTNLSVDQSVLRIDPSAHADVDIVATSFGAPAAGQVIGLQMLRAGGPLSALTFPASLTAGADGRARARFTAADPGHPRADVDGAVYVVLVTWGVSPVGSAPDPRALIVVRVFDFVPAVVSPKWSDVRDVLAEYARMYPWMKGRMDLSDYGTVSTTANATLIDTTLGYPLDDPRYMPVTRDLSDGKSKKLRRWIAAGCPA